MKRKILSMMLALCLTLTLLPCTALADSTETQADAVATVGGTGYETLTDALAAVTKDAALTSVSDDVWPLDTPVYYNGSFYKAEGGNGALENAIIAANEADSADTAKIYIRPNYVNSGSLLKNAHQAFTTNIAIYGNNAALNCGWEPVLDHVDTVLYPAMPMKKAISVAMYNLHNGAGIWGVRTSNYQIDVTLENCKNVHELMLNDDKASADSVTNYTVINCTFDGEGYASPCPVTTTCAGNVTVKDCTFSNLDTNYVININNKNGGDTDVAVSDCEFNNCGKDKKEIVRLTGEADTAKITAELDNLTFDESGNENAIIIGNRKEAANNADVSCTIKNTAATVTVFGKGDDEAKCVSQITRDDFVVADNAKLPENVQGGMYTVSFDAVGIENMKVTAGTAIVLPKLEGIGSYNFIGWMFDGALYTAGTYYVVSCDTAFLAVWNYNPPADETYYNVNVAPSANGSVSVSSASVKEGSVVTVTAAPDTGYALEAISVLDVKGNNIALTENGDGSYSFKMPKSDVIAAAAFKEVEDSKVILPFTDVESDKWYYEYVEYVYNNKLMDGITSETFGPKMTTNRAMLVTVLYRLEGSPAVTAKNSFTDVPDGKYFTDAVTWAAANGIVKGDGDGTFRPLDDITREEFVTILYRYGAMKGYDVAGAANLAGYPDADSVSTWAADAVKWAVSEGYVSGRDTGEIDPSGCLQRGELAKILTLFSAAH